MAITFRAASSIALGSPSTSITLAAPAGTVGTDVVLALICADGATGAISITANTSSQWTSISTTQGTTGGGATYQVAAFWGLGSATDYVFNLSPAGTETVIGCTVGYVGVDNTSPIDISGAQTNDPSSTTCTAPTVTTTKANDLLVGFFGCDDTLGGAVQTFSAEFGTHRLSGGNRDAGVDTSVLDVCDAIQVAAGASGSKTVTVSRTAFNVGTLIALAPAAAALTPQDFELHTWGRGGVASWRLAAHAAYFAPTLTVAQATIPPKNGPPLAVVLPEFFVRTQWNPERTHVWRAGWTQALWAIPPTWKPAPVLPESFSRPQWNPERTENDRAGWTQALWAIPPAKRPDPVLPESFARPIWNPERSGVFWNSRLIVAVPPWGYEMLGPHRFFPAWNPERSLSVGLPYLPPTWPTTVVLPDSFARTAWSPERSHSVAIPYLPPTWPTTVVAPEWFARPRWNPERTESARAGWTQPLWAVAPTKPPEPLLPPNYTRPIWNPERSGLFERQFVSVVPPPTWGYEVYGPQGLLLRPDRSLLAQAIAVPPRIVPVPLLSWTPSLLDRYVQALRTNPWLDLFLPPFPQPIVSSPSQLIVLVGRQDTTATSGRQDAIALAGQQAPAGVQGSQDAIAILGRQDTGPLSGSQ